MAFRNQAGPGWSSDGIPLRAGVPGRPIGHRCSVRDGRAPGAAFTRPPLGGRWFRLIPDDLDRNGRGRKGRRSSPDLVLPRR